MARIGVFVCHCGTNISSTIDVEKVAEALKNDPGVAYATTYIYMCSDPGQLNIRDAIVEHELDGVVVACCTPTLHETTFRNNVEKAGLNPYRCEIANIREGCSWVHPDKGEGTRKAIEITRSAVKKVSLDLPLIPIEVPITKRALVIGGGIAGMQAALDIGQAGYEVLLVERQPSIGGRMAQFSETFPTLDCAQCILTPKMVEVAQCPTIKLYTYCEVEEITGFLGNFKVKLRKKSKYVDWGKCTGCGLCQEKCPTKVPADFDRGLGVRKAIYTEFPQAVPNKPVIDADHCIYLQTGKCGVCKKICPSDAIDFEQKDEVVEADVGAVIVATGFDLYPIERLDEYGHGTYPDVIDGLQFERMLSASGPTSGEIKRPSDGKVPGEIVFVQCAGSRDPEHHMAYCSKICCMYTAKHALLYKHEVPDGQAYIMYIDIRSGGKGYEEFVQRATEEYGVFYIRGKVSKIFREGDKLIVWGVDTLSGKKVEIAADMVVLATAMVPRGDARELARLVKVATDEYGFLNEAHPKLRPVETLNAGFFLAGCVQAPKDIPETVAQASGAASKVLTLFSHDILKREPQVALVDAELCTGCGYCSSVCPYDAIAIDDRKKVATVNEAICEGCGACAAACPSGAIQHKNFTKKQLMEMVMASTGG